jgi:hypothetical protein
MRYGFDIAIILNIIRHFEYFWRGGGVESSHKFLVYVHKYISNSAASLLCGIDRVCQKERSIFWEVIVLVILSKKVYMCMCSVPNGFRDRATISLYSSLDLAPNNFLPSRQTAPMSEACESV